MEECQGLLELLLRLTGEAHDQVCGNGGAVKVSMEQLDALIIPRGIIFPVHPGQNGVTAGLHGQMEVGGTGWAGRPPGGRSQG